MKKLLIPMALSACLLFCSGCSHGLISSKYLGDTSGSITQTIPPDSAPETAAQAVSGPVQDVPWSQDESFKNAQARAGATLLMGAYRTVLRDPLPGEENNVHLAARYLAGKVVNPGQVFSMNNTIGPYNSARGFQNGPVYIGSQLTTTTGGGVCKMASTLYNVAVICNLTIVERHSHGMPVPYVPYGQDATVTTGVADIRFKNDLVHPILIWTQGVDNILYVGFYGQDPPPQVEWHHDIVQRYKTWTVYRQNHSLPQGTEKVVVQGMDGALVKSWVTVKNGDGTTKTKELGMSAYKPLPNVIERSASQIPAAGRTQ